MKKTLFTAALFLTGIWMCGAELKTTKTSVEFGDSKLNIWPSGIMTLTNKQGLFTNWYLHFATKHPGKWFTMSHKSCNIEALPTENGVWKFKASVPVSETEKADAAMELSVTPFNTIEITCGWKTADMKKILETGFFVSFPVKLMEGRELLIGGQAYKIANETKYGWFSKTLENPEFKVFQGDPSREYALSASGKYYVSIGTVKDGSVTIRINALPGVNEMKLTFTPR